MSKPLKAVVIGGTGAVGALAQQHASPPPVFMTAATARSAPPYSRHSVHISEHIHSPHAGREVVGQLLNSAKYGSVVTVGRRGTEVPASYSSQAGYDGSKLKQVVVDMDKLEEQARDAFAGRGPAPELMPLWRRTTAC